MHDDIPRVSETLPTVSAVLGTATFGSQLSEEDSHSLLDRAADLGFTWLDTSTSYPLGSGPDVVGVTESILGRWLFGRRDDAFVATKIYNRTGPKPWQLGLSRRHVLAAVDGSLERLGTDRIDLLQLHRFDREVPLEETLEALADLVAAGKVIHIGVCNFLADQIARIVSTGDRQGFPLVRSAQVRFNPLMRGSELDVLPTCRERGIAVLPFNILAGGLLTGKYTQDAGPGQAVRFSVGEAGKRYAARYWNDDNFATIEALSSLAKESGVPLPALALGWVAAQPMVTAPIVGVSRMSQLEETARYLAGPLDSAVVEQVDAITARHRRFVPELEFESS